MDDLSIAAADGPESFIDAVVRAAASLEPMTGKDLDQFAAIYMVKRQRRFWVFKESDRSLRDRIGQMLKPPQPFTVARIEQFAVRVCVGVESAHVDDEPGFVWVSLRHKWWAWPWKWSNRRRVYACSDKWKPAGVVVSVM